MPYMGIHSILPAEVTFPLLPQSIELVTAEAVALLSSQSPLHRSSSSIRPIGPSNSYNCRCNTAVSDSCLRYYSDRTVARWFITRFSRECLEFGYSFKVIVEVIA